MNTRVPNSAGEVVSEALRPSTQDYFELLRARALHAREDGNYAISAALVIRERGVEVVTVGANTVFGSRDPSGHAEMNAIRVAREFGVEGSSSSVANVENGGSVIVRPAPEGARETVLYTTLEPCPMCTVCIINAGIQRVVIAAEDAPSGTMLGGRLKSLPPLWPHLARAIELEVILCQSHDATNADTYLPPALRSDLIDIFTSSREPLDLELAGEGVLDTATTVTKAAGQMAQATRRRI